MAQFDAFSPCGFFTFGSDPSPAEAIYNTLCETYRGLFDLSVGTYAEARIYALAMTFASARQTITQARNQASPATAYEKIPSWERDFRVVPGANDTIETRRARLVALELLNRGSREEALTTALKAEIGSGLVLVRATNDADRKTWPADPSLVGTDPADDAPLVFGRLLDDVALLGTPVSVPISILSDVNPAAQQALTVEPEVNVVAERVRPTLVSGINDPAGTGPHITATFTKPHSSGAWFVSCAPLWISTQREVQIIVTTAAGRDPATRRKIHEVMRRHSPMVSRWQIIETADGVHTGPFVVGTSRVGSTAVGSAAFTF